MPYPTRGDVKARFQNRLDDPGGNVFSEAVFAPAFGEAYDALFQAFLVNQVPRIELIVTKTIPAGTTEITPAGLGITDWGDYIYLSERAAGSSDDFKDLVSVDRLWQRPQTDRLVEFNYRNDTFYFVGSTNSVELQVKYDSSGSAPDDDDTVITVDGSLTFLSNYAVGVAGDRKGYDEIAAKCMLLAVGPRYDQGVIGGELYRIVQNRVRSRQKVQIAPKPYSSRRRLIGRRAVPYVAAQWGTTGGTTPNPVQFSSATAPATIVGTLDGTNKIFFLSVGVKSAIVYLNGVLQTQNLDYTRLNNQITFTLAPNPGDIITAEAFPA